MPLVRTGLQAVKVSEKKLNIGKIEKRTLVEWDSGRQKMLTGVAF